NYTATGKVTVNGDTTLAIDDTKLVQSQKYTLNFITGTTWRFKCYITDSNITSYTSTTPLVSIYTQETGADGLTTGRGGNDNLLAPKGYNYFCYADTNGGGNYFESGTDKLAVGVLPSSIGDMITVPLTQFQDF
ncbi:MAG TPA: hypothetical protein PLY93_09685, partial [Turneriella sp.]|nr:hypothetical protein [Turneriella sp.]